MSEGFRPTKLLHGSAWILVGLAIQSVLGFVFWFVASRVASSDAVGNASALYTAIQFINYASGLGLTVALARFAVDRSSDADSLLGWSVLATIVSSFIGGSLYLLVSNSEATDLVSGSVLSWLIFCTYTAGMSVWLVLDVRLMAAGQWAALVTRIAVCGLVRLPLVGLDVAMSDDSWLYHLMLAPLAAGGFVMMFLLPRLDAGRLKFSKPKSIEAFSRYAGVNWVATLASQAPQFVLPLIVAQQVAPSINASFFLAWTLTGMVLLLPGAISQVLLVEGSKDLSEADNRAREAFKFSLALAVLAWLGSLVAGPVAAAVFGSDYKRIGTLLPALMFAGIPWAITSVRLSEARIRRDSFATMAMTATLGIGIVVPAVLTVGSGGTDAAVRAFVGGNIAAAVVAIATHRRATRLAQI